MNLLSLALLGTGGVLLYSAVKGYDPRDVVRSALTGKGMSTVSLKYDTGVTANGAVYNPTTDPTGTGAGL